MGRLRTGRRRAAAAVSSTAAAIAVAILVAAAALGYGLYASATTGGEMSSMSLTVSSQRAEIGALNSTLSALEASVPSLQGKVVAVSGQLNSTQATLASLRGNVTSLQEKLAAVSGQLNATESADSAALAQLRTEVQSLNATIRELTGQLGALASPALVQQTESTCSYICTSGSTEATFLDDVRSGDMLVVTVVSDDLTNLVVADSLGTKISLAVSATTSPDCISNTGTCQADIYWGLLASSGPDTVTVSEGSSPRALRIATWEFRGVDAVTSAVSCAPVCASASYSSPGILVATAMNVNGSGPGFVWYPYAVSGVAGSEYQVVSGPGTTTFPFSTGDINVEVGAVLGPSP